MTMIGSISAKISADDSEFQQSVKRTVSGAGTAARAMTAWGAAAAGAAVAAGAAIFKATAESIKQLDALSYAANTSVADLQRMAYGSRTVGIEQDKLADILKDVNDKIGDFNATGAGPMADFFEKIGPKVGITAQHFKNLSGPEALQLYASSLEKANVSQAEMTFYMEALASDSTLLTPLLRDNGKAMGELSAEAERLGIGLSEIDVAKVQQANAAMAKVGAITDSAAQQFTIAFAPAVAAAIEEVVMLAEEFGGFGRVAENILDGTVKAVGVLGNSFRGIQIIVKGLELGFEAFSFAINRIFLAVSRSVDRLINGAIASINGLTQNLNKILPGEGIGAIEAFLNPATKLFDENTAHWEQAIAGTLAEMHNLAMQELPSQAIERWADTVKAKAAEAAEATAAAMTGRSAQGGEGSPVDTPQGLSEDELKAIELRLDHLRQAGMTELELKQMQYDMDHELLITALENEALTREEYNQLALEAAQRHADEITEIDRIAAEKRIAMEEAERRAKMSGVKNMFSNLSQLMNTGSRKMFEIGKAASLANAIVSAYEAITSSYAAGSRIGGPPVGAAFAAAAGAASFAQVKAIQSQSFSAGAGGAGMSFQNGQPAMNAGGAVGPAQPSRNISISLSGSTFGAGGIRDLIQQINGELGDGVRLGVAG